MTARIPHTRREHRIRDAAGHLWRFHLRAIPRNSGPPPPEATGDLFMQAVAAWAAQGGVVGTDGMCQWRQPTPTQQPKPTTNGLRS